MILRYHMDGCMCRSFGGSFPALLGINVLWNYFHKILLIFKKYNN